MIKNVLPVLLLLVNFLAASGQPQYCRLWHKKSINFFWDWHGDYDYKVPPGISKETIYHQKINSRDSALEKVIWFNRQGLPVKTEHYSSISNEGIIQTDTFFYNSDNLLIQRKSIFLSCSKSKDSQLLFFRYDRLHREIRKEGKGQREYLTTTVYDNNKIIKINLSSNGYPNWKEVHFYNNNKEDSMQFIWNDNLLYTAEYVYDTVQLKKTAYRWYEKVRRQHTPRETEKALFVREEYNPDGTGKVQYNKWLTNWNNTKDVAVELHISHNKDKTVRDCLYIVKGKKAFIKKHFYEYY